MEWWTDQAACRKEGHPWNDGFIEPITCEMGVARQRACQKICRTCPVFQQCYDWVTESDPDPLPYAYAAGLTSRQRKRLRQGHEIHPIYQHGTLDRYDVYNCRCSPCRAANRRRDAKQKQG